MLVRRFESAKEFLDRAGPFLLQAEAENNLILGLVGDMAAGTRIWDEMYLATVEEGEQVVTGAITVDNVINFSTHIPAAPETCDAEYGIAMAYQVNFRNASGSTSEFLGGGLVPTPVAGKVLICKDGNCVPVPFCIGCGDEGSAIGVGKVGGGINWTQPKSRVFWNIDQVDD